MSKKLTYSFVKEQFEKEGYTLLSKEYINSSSKLEYRCPKGTVYKISWNKWQGGRRCPCCTPKGRFRHRSIDSIKVEFEKEGYILLTKKYKNCDQKLEYICNNGHKYSTSWDSWTSKGNRCAICNNNAILSIDYIYEEFKKERYTLLTTKYKNSKQRLYYICPNNHVGTVTWNNWHLGNRCSKCSNTGTSSGQLKLLEELKSIFPKQNFIEQDRTIIKPYEIDILILDKKLAIEYCGLYWHSELAGKDKNYHLNKLKLCEEKGYRLITIFEDEWLNNREIVISRIMNILGALNYSIIYARKCIIKEIPVKEARDFCNKNHLQGYGNSSIKLGAFYKHELVSIMTFSKPSIAKGSKNEKDVWELNRFCSKINHQVIGIASKLLKFFERNYDWRSIFSYADRRWSDGNLYKKIGFEFSHNSKPNYWYIKGIKRIHRFSLRKTKDDPKNLTEWAIRMSQGWNRIWDCGSIKYEKLRRS